MKRTVKMAIFLGVVIVISMFGTLGGSAVAVKKNTVEIKFTSKTLTIASGSAKISIKASAKQEIVLRIFDKKGRLVAVFPKFSIAARAVKNIYWNGRVRTKDGNEVGDYVSPGYYRVKVSGEKDSRFSSEILALSGAKQKLSKLAVSPQGFVGEKSIAVAFCVSKKQDVFIRLINKSGKDVYLNKIRDVKPKKIQKVVFSVSAVVGEYSLKVSSCGVSQSRKIKLMRHFSSINQFNINQDKGSYIASWAEITGARSYELHITRVGETKPTVLKGNMGGAESNIICNVSGALKAVGEYLIELYASGDSYHPISRVGRFQYSILGKLSNPMGLKFVEDTSTVSAYCDPVPSADTYGFSVFFNGTLLKTEEILGSSKLDITDSIRENGYGEYTFGIKAKSKKNKCYLESETATSEVYTFTGLKTPSELDVSVDDEGNYIANWRAMEGVNYYFLEVYIDGVRESGIACGLNKATITTFLPAKGKKYQLVVYSLRNELHGQSLPSAKKEFVA